MRTVCIIPARYNSTRFPGKPLVPIRGANGESKPMIQRTWEIACKALPPEDVWVATDDKRITRTAAAFGANVLDTGDWRNGTERCAEGARILSLSPSDIVINLQGDSCMTPHGWVRTLASAAPHVGTVIQPLRRKPVPGDVCAVTDKDHRALYFSRAEIPHAHMDADFDFYQHIGIYAYRVSVLIQYPMMPVGRCERAEGLEQLRFLENGHSIQCVNALPEVHDLFEVNSPPDVVKVEEGLKKWNIA